MENFETYLMDSFLDAEVGAGYHQNPVSNSEFISSELNNFDHHPQHLLPQQSQQQPGTLKYEQQLQFNSNNNNNNNSLGYYYDQQHAATEQQQQQPHFLQSPEEGHFYVSFNSFIIFSAQTIEQ